MDLPDANPQLLAEDLKNLRSINRLFGGLAAVRKHIRPFLEKSNGRPVASVLDMATGSADHPLALVDLARRLERQVSVTAVDSNPHMVEISRQRTAHIPAITVIQGDIRYPEWPDGSFDIVLCSLALHHFSEEEARGLVQTMRRLSRIGFIVNDLRRSRLGEGAAWLWNRATTRNPMTLNDAVVSVQRGFTEDELAQMGTSSGVRRSSVHREPFFRLVLVGEH
ncbi:MAG: methyltransferase domain-containing protein [Bacteroidota bacterium]